jgi:alpha-D-ribose 1-methylphosphonate 5-triphosphate synthase subunit PhnL
MLPLVEVAQASKSFTMHLQGGLTLPVIQNANLIASAGECVVLSGPSGAGKSSLLKMIYGNYRCDKGAIYIYTDGVRIDIVRSEPRQIVMLRRHAIGYVSQFLRVVPRVAALDIVAEPLISGGVDEEDAKKQAGLLLKRLNIAERLWGLPPATFSGGEQQRVNIARGFIRHYPILLLDEPTASLDAANRSAVVDLITEKKKAGVAMIAIVHDDEIRNRIADRCVDVTTFSVTG